MSHAPYVGICECTASKRMHRLLGSSSSEIGPSVSQVMLSIASEVTGISGVNSIGEDKSMIFKTYRGPMPIHPAMVRVAFRHLSKRLFKHGAKLWRRT